MVPESVLQWKPLAERYAAAHPPLLPNEILAIIWSESTGNPNAVNPSDPSWGLMQVTELIAKAYGGIIFPPRTGPGPKVPPPQLFNPEVNMMIGSAFLAHLKETYSEHFPDTWPQGYNQGEGNLTRGVPDPDYIAAFNSHMAALSGE